MILSGFFVSLLTFNLTHVYKLILIKILAGCAL